jgi:hypothetical protein
MRMLNLTREECFTPLMALEADGARVCAKCISPGYREPKLEIQCGYCGSLLGRRRV